MSNLDFLDAPEGAETAAPTPVAEQPATPAPEPSTDGPARGPDGKFAPKATDEPPAPATPPEAASAPAAPQEPATPPPGFVPIAALQEIRREMQAMRQQQPVTPPPDPIDDPAGYEAHQEDQRIALNAQWSHKLALATHGEEAVTKAQQWAEQRFERDPVFRQQSLAHPDPFGFAIAEHQRDQALQLFADPKTLDAFRAWQAAQMGQAPPPVPNAAPVAVPQPPTPPRSLAAAPSAGGAKPGATPAGPGEAFNAVFKE